MSDPKYSSRGGHSAKAHFGLCSAVWAVLLVAAALSISGPIAADSPARESLNNFPTGVADIISGDSTQRFRIWIANTTARSEQGLMFVPSLAHDQGMLFPRSNPGPMSMWMKNTLIPLDMLFVDSQGEIIYIRRNATPKSEAIIAVPPPIVAPAAAVLELPGGECDRRRITQGDHIRVTRDN